MCKEHEVPIPPDAILWKVIPKRIDDPDDGTYFLLEWGWTAGMTDEQVSKLAPDYPRGKGSVKVPWDCMDELIMAVMALRAQGPPVERREVTLPPELIAALNENFHE